MQIFPTRMCNVTAWRHSRLRAHWLMTLVGGGGCDWGRSMYSAFPGNCSVSYHSFVYGRSLWEELNGGENYLYWKANMLPLLSITHTLLFDGDRGMKKTAMLAGDRRACSEGLFHIKSFSIVLAQEFG